MTPQLQFQQSSQLSDFDTLGLQPTIVSGSGGGDIPMMQEEMEESKFYQPPSSAASNYQTGRSFDEDETEPISTPKV